jgi:dienelactone hydrolase
MVPAFAVLTAMGGEKLLLPDPLTTEAGDKVTTVEQWREIRRPEVLELFRKHVYGRAPIGRPADLRFEEQEIDRNAMGGRATLKRIGIHFSGPGGKGRIDLALFVPNDAPRPAPGFVLICNRDRENIDPTRQKKSPFWPAERIVDRGYVAATFHNSDLDPDKYDGFKNGVHGIFTPDPADRAPDAWGTIAAWAWGASRVMDYFESDPDIDEKHIGVLGHSRGGKTALWCGAEDERFALTISNNSGCTGAALARNKKGELVQRINKVFPHWFCENYKKYNGREDDLPVDQHQLIALMAPRLVYVASATRDAWADPEGEFLSAFHAGPVYRLFGLRGVGATKMPEPQQPLHAGHVGYHLRAGKHNLVEYDWDQYMDFADRHWKKRQPAPEGDNR